MSGSGNNLSGPKIQPAFGVSSTPAASTPAFGFSSSSAFGVSSKPAASTPALGFSSTLAFGSTIPPSVSGSTPGVSFRDTQPAFGVSSTPAVSASTTSAFGVSPTPANGATTSPYGFQPSPAFGGQAKTQASSQPVVGATSTTLSDATSTTSLFNFEGQFQQSQPHSKSSIFSPQPFGTSSQPVVAASTIFSDATSTTTGLIKNPFQQSQPECKCNIFSPSSCVASSHSSKCPGGYFNIVKGEGRLYPYSWPPAFPASSSSFSTSTNKFDIFAPKKTSAIESMTSPPTSLFSSALSSGAATTCASPFSTTQSSLTTSATSLVTTQAQEATSASTALSDTTSTSRFKFEQSQPDSKSSLLFIPPPFGTASQPVVATSTILSDATSTTTGLFKSPFQQSQPECKSNIFSPSPCVASSHTGKGSGGYLNTSYNQPSPFFLPPACPASPSSSFTSTKLFDMLAPKTTSTIGSMPSPTPSKFTSTSSSRAAMAHTSPFSTTQPSSTTFATSLGTTQAQGATSTSATTNLNNGNTQSSPLFQSTTPSLGQTSSPLNIVVVPLLMQQTHPTLPPLSHTTNPLSPPPSYAFLFLYVLLIVSFSLIHIWI